LDDAIGRQQSRVQRTRCKVAATAALVQAEAGDHAKFVDTCVASAYLLRAMTFKPLPAGFIVPAQPVRASKPPSGADWVHEIKHDGYRMIVRRDGPSVRLYSRNAYDWTVRLAAIAAAAQRIKANSFTIDGEAVVLGPDGLSLFDELRRREAADTAILYAFDLIEHDARICATIGSSIARMPWHGYCARSRPAFDSMNTSPRTALSYSRTLAGLAQKASCRRRRRGALCRTLQWETVADGQPVV
jgi:hypothetical protein